MAVGLKIISRVIHHPTVSAVASSATSAAAPERILDLTLRTGPFCDRYGENPDGLTLAKLKRQPNGINLGPMVPQLPDILGTAERRIRLASQYLLDDLPRLARCIDWAPDDLVLVSDATSNRSCINLGAPRLLIMMQTGQASHDLKRRRTLEHQPLPSRSSWAAPCRSAVARPPIRMA